MDPLEKRTKIFPSSVVTRSTTGFPSSCNEAAQHVSRRVSTSQDHLASSFDGSLRSADGSKTTIFVLFNTTTFFSSAGE